MEKKKAKVTFKTLFDKPELNPPPPVKPCVLHFYSRRFYHSRIKGHVAERWAEVSRLPNPPKEIKVRNAVTKERWDAETPAFRAEVLEAIAAEHNAAVEAYQVATSGEAPTTPAEYDT